MTTTKDTPALCTLDGHGVLCVSGAEARDFLNAQLCNDMGAVSPTASRLGGYCNPKGRLLACPRILQIGDAYYLRVPKTLLDAVAKRLTMFVMRAQVAVRVCEGDDDITPCIGVVGDAALTLPESTTMPPAEIGACATIGDGDGVIVRVPSHDKTPRFEIYGKASALGGVAEQADSDFARWRRDDILAGLPVIYPETSGLFVPQMANLDLVDALSYTKGCYPGQEVVARTHYLGKIKRRMVGFRSEHLPQPGDEVYAPGFSTEQASGAVIDACAVNTGEIVGLAVMRLKGLDDAAMHFAAADGPTATVSALPYSLEETPAPAEAANEVTQ